MGIDPSFRSAAPSRLWLAPLATLFALANCSGCTDQPASNKQTTKATAPCLPSLEMPPALANADRAHVYIDRSLSMSGYVSPQLGRSQALADLLRLLERQLPTLVGASEYRSFGAQISDPMQPAEVASFASPAAYECQSCDNRESHIDSVLERIAQSPPAALSVVVTDLWLDNRSFQGSDEVALGEPLRDILRGGRAVGVIGIRAPFNGAVYEVPGVGTYRGAQDRPLFVVMVGPPDKLNQIYQRLRESQSPALAPDRLRFSLYSTAEMQPVQGPQVGPRGRGAVTSQAPRGGRLRNQRQLRLTLSHAGQGGGSVAATFHLAPQIESLVWQGAPVQRTRVWKLNNESELEQCSPNPWTELPALPGTWQPTSDPLRFAFSIDNRVGTRLPAPGTYYVVAEHGVTGLTAPNAQSSWMEEWSLRPEDAAAFVRDNPTVFRALNLGRLRTILDEELQRQLAGRTRMMRRSAFLLRLER